MDNRKNAFFAIEMSDIVFWIMKWKWVVISITIVFAILGYALGICIFAGNLGLTIAALFGIAIGISVRFCILKRAH